MNDATEKLIMGVLSSGIIGALVWSFNISNGVTEIATKQTAADEKISNIANNSKDIAVMKNDITHMRKDLEDVKRLLTALAK